MKINYSKDKGGHQIRAKPQESWRGEFKGMLGFHVLRARLSLKRPQAGTGNSVSFSIETAPWSPFVQDYLQGTQGSSRGCSRPCWPESTLNAVGSVSRVGEGTFAVDTWQEVFLCGLCLALGCSVVSDSLRPRGL